MKHCSKQIAKPFVKWVGGKSQLLPRLRALYPKRFNAYFEPFLGGGAVFFDLNPNKAYLNDINEALTVVYRVIKEKPTQLVGALRKLRTAYTELDDAARSALFYSIRKEFNGGGLDTIKRSAYLVFLNKTCYNGMYRENSSGEFNVPFGRYKNPAILDEENILAVRGALANANLTSLQFHKAVEKANAGDFVYFDPPYFPLNRTSSFTTYSGNGFVKGDQEALRDLFVELDNRGCFVMLSNSHTPLVQKLYDGYRQEEVEAARAINCKGAGRGKIKELVILNY